VENENKIDFQMIVEHMDDCVFVTDHEGKVLYVNPSYERHTGIKKEELLGRYITDILSAGNLFKGGAALDVVRTKQKCVRLSNVTKPGSECWGYAVGIPHFGEDGELKNVIVSSHTLRSFTELDDDYGQFVSMLEKVRLIQSVTLNGGDTSPPAMVGVSEAMVKIKKNIEIVAPSDATVLLTGESGVGKEVIANEIHKGSTRQDKPFIKVNCAAIPAALLESEMFGYEKGAFSGADKAGKPGLFEMADTGTILLDEIGELPMELQPKLLRAIQAREVARVGGTNTYHFDTRIISITNCDLKAKMREGTFRDDLYYRINVIPIYVPPLRERPDDILPLCDHFIGIFSEKYHQDVRLEEEARRMLQQYSWPGNIRELENVIEYLTIFATENDGVVNGDMLLRFMGAPQSVLSPSVDMNMNLNDALAACEKDMIQRALDISKTLREAGAMLGIDVSTVSRKLRQYDLKYGNLK